MRYHAFATDYDGTLAHDGVVTEQTIAALQKLRASGRQLLLVTGRIMDELIATFPHYQVFDVIVAENGGLLHFPSDGREVVLSEPPSPKFLEMLRQAGVAPLSEGKVIVATWDSQKEPVLNAIQELGLELQIIFNKGALMILPAGINKASGLRAALQHLKLSPHNSVGVGDAENDHAFLSACECSAAVANAIPSLKERSDVLLEGDHGSGVEELIARLLENDLSDVGPKLRCHILLGNRDDGSEERVTPHGTNILVTGTSGGGKSTLTTGILERLAASCYQFVAIDPEGDYEKFEGAVVLGDIHHAPDLGEISTVLEDPDQNIIMNLLAVPVEDRPNFFETLLPRILELRARTGHPHWMILDEAHHLLPANAEKAASIPPDFSNLMLITLGPDCVRPQALAEVNEVIAVGDHPDETIATFCKQIGVKPPHLDTPDLEKGRVLRWCVGDDHAEAFQVAPCRSQRTRHRRKYAEGELTPDRSFFFTGPNGKLNLRAQNLKTFVQLMEGIDDETWLHHLQKGEYSLWFRENIKSNELAERTERIEKGDHASAAESRAEIKHVIEEMYTLPL